jgi:hypothetical protein
MGREGAYHGRDERRQPQPTGEPSEERGRERVREEEEGEGVVSPLLDHGRGGGGGLGRVLGCPSGSRGRGAQGCTLGHGWAGQIAFSSSFL